MILIAHLLFTSLCESTVRIVHTWMHNQLKYCASTNWHLNLSCISGWQRKSSRTDYNVVPDCSGRLRSLGSDPWHYLALDKGLLLGTRYGSKEQSVRNKIHIACLTGLPQRLYLHELKWWQYGLTSAILCCFTCCESCYSLSLNLCC